MVRCTSKDCESIVVCGGSDSCSTFLEIPVLRTLQVHTIQRTTSFFTTTKLPYLEMEGNPSVTALLLTDFNIVSIHIRCQTAMQRVPKATSLLDGHLVA